MTSKYETPNPGHDVHEDGGRSENTGGADVHSDRPAPEQQGERRTA